MRLQVKILKAAFFLTGGAAISLAVAWWSAWVYVQSEYDATYMQSPGVTLAYGPGSEGDRWVTDIQSFSFGVWISRMQIYSDGMDWYPSLEIKRRKQIQAIPKWSRARTTATNQYDGRLIFECAAGWPFTSWKGEWLVDMYTGKQSSRFAIPIEFENYYYPGHREIPIPLPLMPIFPGLVFNSIIWGSLMYIVLMYPIRFCHFLTRYRRRRQGQCPNCAYDITNLSTCPECGQGVVQRPAKGRA